MNLTSEAASHAALVNVASVQVPSLNRVTPSNPNDSYLVRKLEGDPRHRRQSDAAGGPFLDQTTIDSVRLWITNGAAP